MQGNTLSYLYSVEWPAFVVVAGIGWYQMVRDTPEDIEERRRFRAQMRIASAEVVARTLPRSAFAIEVDSAQSSGRVLGQGDEGRRALPGGGGSSTGTDVAVRNDATIVGQDPGPAPADEMTDYNRYLALLAVKGKAKTWRNPRGL